MTTTRNSFTVAVALTVLSVVGCKKQETTPPDVTAAEDEDEDEDEVAEEAAEEVEEAEAILSKANFDETINDHMQEVSDCYVAALGRDDKLAGMLDAEFTFGPDGVTGVIAAEGSSLNEEGLVQCIADAAKTWDFGTPKDEGMTMRYSFNLAPAG